MLVLQKGLILPVPMYGGSYFFIQPKFCESLIYGLHRGFTLAFTLDFLDLTTFLPQILGKIYSSDFLTTFYDNNLWFIPQQVRFLAGSF